MKMMHYEWLIVRLVMVFEWKKGVTWYRSTTIKRQNLTWTFPRLNCVKFLFVFVFLKTRFMSFPYLMMIKNKKNTSLLHWTPFLGTCYKKSEFNSPIVRKCAGLQKEVALNICRDKKKLGVGIFLLKNGVTWHYSTEITRHNLTTTLYILDE